MISVKVKDRNQVAAKLKIMSVKLKNPRALYARFGVQGIKWIDENFRKQGGLLKEGKWKPLSPSTIRSRTKRKKKRTTSTQILIDSGELRKSFETSFTSRGVLIGTGKKYGIYHDSDVSRRKLPQRRMVPRQKDTSMVIRLTKTLRNYLREIGRGII